MIQSTVRFIENNFSTKITVKDWSEVNRLPIYLSNSYEFKEIVLIGQSFILVNRNSNEAINIDTIKIHISKIKEFRNMEHPVIFSIVKVSNYLKKQLIENRISFVVPGKMIFIFELGSIIYERQRSNFSNLEIAKVDRMSPSTQSLFLYLITTNDFNSTMEVLADKLDVTKMSVSRGFNELKILGIIEKDEYEDSRLYHFKLNRKDTWHNTQQYMINPVMKTIYIHEHTFESFENQFTLSGESALSTVSMLSSPNISIYGITNKIFKKIYSRYEELPVNDKDSVTIQLYKHALQSVDRVLHPLSIALVLKDEEDERVKKEVNEMLINYFNDEIY